MSTLQAVQDIYEAFGRGDVPAILGHLADDVEWDYAYRAAPNPLPWLQPRRGREGAGEFFGVLRDQVEIHSFAIRALTESPGVVIALIDIEGTVRSTAKRIVERDETHVWRFDGEGKVVRFRHCADTYQHAMAYLREREPIPLPIPTLEAPTPRAR